MFSALSSVNELLNDNPQLLDWLQSGDDQLVKEITACWDNAAFSNISDEALHRYFTYEVNTYVSIMEKIDAERHRAAGSLAGPIEHLRIHFYEVFDKTMIAPNFYLTYVESKLDIKINTALAKLSQMEGSSPELVGFINGFFQQPRENIRYLSLDYFAKVLDAIIATESASELVLGQMIIINFNHLDFYSGQQREIKHHLEELDGIGERKEFLREKLLWLKSLPENVTYCYDLSFPSLRTLLIGWIDDLLWNQNADHSIPDQVKLKFKLPASELACFLFASSSQGWYDCRSLQSVFHFTAAHFSSKNKENLSQKNLSKEYYSITQQTAARTRERLQQMIAAINKRYFPA